MSETKGMSRREKLQYEAKQRQLNGESKLGLSFAAVNAVDEDRMIDKALFGMAEISEDNIEAQNMAAYSQEFMYASDTENASDLANACISFGDNSDL